MSNARSTPNDKAEKLAPCTIVALGAVLIMKEEGVLMGIYGDFRFLFSISGRGAGEFSILSSDFGSFFLLRG